ncbi:hypothetical protein IP88_07790 [alpha proteobacterium AAP81b]|nr:hypothetical protein IP88_07790 [alpha proteobacterium AAP81b]
MDAPRLFELANAAVLPGWAMLALAPLRREWAVVGARVVAALLCGFYFSLLVTGLAGAGPPEGAGFTSLEGVRLLLSSPPALLAGWVHYLAFDLWVASWQVADAPPARLPHWLVLPCLALTFVAGPVGLLIYLLLKAGRLLKAGGRGSI